LNGSCFTVENDCKDLAQQRLKFLKQAPRFIAGADA